MDVLNVVLDPEQVKSPASDNVPLTKKQRDTLDKLRANKINEIKSKRDLSAVLNTAFNNDMSKETKKLIVKSYNTWLLNQPNPPKSIAEANKKVRESISKKSTSKKSRKEMMIEESEIFNEIKEEIAPPKEEEEKHDDGDKPKSTSQAPAPAPAPASAPLPTRAQDETARLQAEALAKIAEQGEVQQAPAEQDGNMFSDYINTGSQFYKDNKKTINKVLGALTPKKLEDGSYLTELIGLEVPEIEVFQKVIKAVGLGFTDEDKKLYEKMLSTSEKTRNSVSNEDKLRLALKGIINPDQMGVLLKKTGEIFVEEAKGWWEKLTTGKERLTPDQREVQEKIDERRKKIDEDRKRKAAVDEWFGDDSDKVVVPTDTNPFKPIAGGGDGKISGGGTAYNPDLPFVPVDDNIISSYDILLPPNWKDFRNTDAGKSIAEIMSSIHTGGIANLVDKTGKLDLIKFRMKDPEGYAKWKEATDAYNAKIGKAALDRTGAIDYNISKNYIDNASSFTEDLLKKAIASGEISREAGEGIYDLWSNFEKVKSGDLQLSYDEVANLQQKLIEFLPRKIVEENSDMINKYIADNKDYLAPAFEGDSDLGNFDWLQNILEGKTAEGDIDTDLIKEKTIKPEKQLPMVETKLRYRGRWGGTDEIFERQNDEIQKRNLVIEVQRLRESVDVTNKLVQAQILTEQRRFNNCFAPPEPEPEQSKALPSKFKRDHRAIFQPVILPNSLRPFEKNTRNESDFQQYKEWTPSVPETTARFQQMKNPLNYPSIVDMATGGEPLYVAPARDFDYILNQRFTR